MEKDIVNTFDIDGVIDFEGKSGIYPGPRDIIITGRSFEEEDETIALLRKRGIENHVVFNPLPFNEKSRITSGQHKGMAIKFMKLFREHGFHFEDDPIQIEEILKIDPTIKIVYVKSNFVELENKRRNGEI